MIFSNDLTDIISDDGKYLFNSYSADEKKYAKLLL